MFIVQFQGSSAHVYVQSIIIMIHLECRDPIQYYIVNEIIVHIKNTKDNWITHRSHIFFTFVRTNSEFLADVQSFSLLFTLFNVRAYVITWRVRRFLIGCLRSKRGGQSRSFSARIQWFWWDHIHLIVIHDICKSLKYIFIKVYYSKSLKVF